VTRQELSVFLQEWFCGCGSPHSAAASLLKLLRLHPLYDHRRELEVLLPDKGIQHLVLYMLDCFDLTEHGSSVGGAWLTDKGKAVMEALAGEEANGFLLLEEPRCVHGYGFGEEHECQ
jgi:hypothetical protein